MKARHLFSGQIYQIQNYSVAGDQLFRDKEDIEYFKSRISKYIGGISELIDFVLVSDHFSMVIKIKDKRICSNFFRNKKKDKRTKSFYIPHESFIFSQQMANLQVSYVKYYNHKYKRKGCLFRQRYDRFLIESSASLKLILEGVSWLKSFGMGGNFKEGNSDPENLSNEVVDGEGVGFKSIDLFDLRGSFQQRLEIDIIPKFHRRIISIHKEKFKFGPNLN